MSSINCILLKKKMRKTEYEGCKRWRGREVRAAQRHRFTSNLLANLMFQITGVMVINIDKYALSSTLYIYTLCTAKAHIFIIHTRETHLTQTHILNLQGESNHHQYSQSHYPSQYNGNSANQRQQSGHQQSQQNQTVQYQQTHQQQQHQDHQQNQQQSSFFRQSAFQQRPEPVARQQSEHVSRSRDQHPQPVFQRQHSQGRQPSQGRAASQGRYQTPARTFPNADPCFMRQNTPYYLNTPSAQNARDISPSTAAFSGGIALNQSHSQNNLSSQQQQSLRSVSPHHTGYSSAATVSPSSYQQTPPTTLHLQTSLQPQYQSHSSLPLSPDPNIPLAGWSPVKPATPVHLGYTQNANQPPVASPFEDHYGGGRQQVNDIFSQKKKKGENNFFFFQLFVPTNSGAIFFSFFAKNLFLFAF